MSDRGSALGAARRLNRQIDDEDRALSLLRADREAASHPANELAADVEAEPGAADAARELGIDAVELAEDPPLLEGRDADPFVADSDANAAIARRDRELDPAALG